jgi:magnesium chelatase family protein
MPEFKKNVLEMLRQPLEDGQVCISRAAQSLTYPASFMLVAAMNPCPCGFLGDPQHPCNCTPLAIQRYRAKISGPLLDRLDLQVEVPRLAHRELAEPAAGESSAAVRQRVETARALQRERFCKEGVHCNARMRPRHLQRFCKPDVAGQALLEKVTERLGLSARSYTRILKVARTIADLAGSAQVETAHLAEAIQYRSLDRRLP